MTVVPEKRQLEDHVHAAVGAQFWGQGVQSSRQLSGAACSAPCEPQPLRLTAPSGLSRTQFLVATRAVRLPVFPGYCHEHGGTVVDRVLLQTGSQRWWAALIGRGKMQRAWNQHTTTSTLDILSDPENYALAATGKVQLADSTVMRVTLQSDSLVALQPLVPQQKLNWTWGSSNALQQQHHQQLPDTVSVGATARAPVPQQQQSRAARLLQGNSMKLQLKQRLEGLDLTADLALNDICVEGVRRYAVTPLQLSIDISPSSSSTKRMRLQHSSSSSSTAGANPPSSSSSSSWLNGLLFRVGVHGVLAPSDAAADSAAAAAVSASSTVHQPAGHVSSSSSNMCRGQTKHSASLHAQGALAWTASKTLWEASTKPWQSAAMERTQQSQQQRQQRSLPVQPLDVTNVTNSSSNVESSRSQKKSPQDVDKPVDASTHSSQAGNNRRNKRSGKQQQQQTGAHSGSNPAVRHQGTTHAGRGSSGSKKRTLTIQGQEISLPLLSPTTVQESLQDTSSSIERLRTDLRSWTSRVQAGELQGLGKKEGAGGLLRLRPGSCWSSFIPGPHFKVCGLVGILGRLPLHQQTLLLPAAIRSGSSSGSAGQNMQQQTPLSPNTQHMTAGVTEELSQPEMGRPLGERARGVWAASATHLDRLVLGSARRLGRSITQESLLRLFGSAGASLQVGEMRRNFADYTRLEAVLDLGLNGPTALSQHPAGQKLSADAGNRTRVSPAGKSSQNPAGSSTQKGIRAASPSRGMVSILGPTAAAAHAAAAAAQPPALTPQPPLLPTAATGSSNSSPRSSTIGSAASAAALPPIHTSAASTTAGGGHVSGQAGASMPVTSAAGAPDQEGSNASHQKHPAFALQDRGAWHSLTVSATQQLCGPLRIRADCRLALDSSQRCPHGKDFLQPAAPLQLLRHITSMRPAVVDAAYGVDVVVPGAGGLVRLVGWYSPCKGEGGLGLRLM